LTQSEISSIEAYALEAFYEDFPRDYRTELRAKGYANFADACAKVIIIHKRLEREEHPRDEFAPGGAQSPAGNPQRDVSSAMPCTPTSNPSSAPNAFDDTSKVCTHCKNYGHLYNECRKRQYRSNNPNPQNNYSNNGFNNHNNSNFNSSRFNNNNNINPKINIFFLTPKFQTNPINIFPITIILIIVAYLRLKGRETDSRSRPTGPTEAWRTSVLSSLLSTALRTVHTPTRYP
ncbi:hypothetical protein ALC62_15369, partial [Cyphomyrmex costatus]